MTLYHNLRSAADVAGTYPVKILRDYRLGWIAADAFYLASDGKEHPLFTAKTIDRYRVGLVASKAGK